MKNGLRSDSHVKVNQYRLDDVSVNQTPCIASIIAVNKSSARLVYEKKSKLIRQYFLVSSVVVYPSEFALCKNVLSYLLSFSSSIVIDQWTIELESLINGFTHTH